ncbi:MAG: DUF4386 domain-containing protein [Anaerolineales bacterium]|nr:DUF4386 domain-containing protein [Anaerolineales bacterium]
MDTNRKTAIIVGVLFIVGTVSGVLSVVFSGAMLEVPDYLIQIAANPTRFTIGALCVLTMGFSLAMIPVVIYPVLKKYNQPLALGYVVFRGALETFTYFATVISWLLLIVLSQEFVKAGAPDGSYFQTLGALLLKSGDQINHILKIVFPLGALMFNYVLYQSKLVPRWLSVWGMIGVTLHLAEGLLTLFGLVPASIETIVALPIALQEMVFAVWLIVKGFNPAVAAQD